MPDAVYVLNGERYLTSGQVSEILGIDQRTVLRWIDRATKKGRCPEILKRLVWTRDPTNRFTYFREDTVREIQKTLVRTRPRRQRK